MRFRTVLALTALAAALPFNAAKAAPQLLGLFADNAVPLHCTNGVCRAELTAICLQEKRDMPAWETPYRVVQTDRIALVGTRADGTAVSTPIGGMLHIESDRGAWAVQISLPEAALRDAGLSRAALTIAGRVVLEPVPVPGDPNPQTEAETAAVAAVFDAAPEKIVGGSAEGLAAAQVLNDMINTLPHVTLDPNQPVGDLWRKTFGSDRADRPGMKRAAAYYKRCGHPLLRVDKATVRNCLEHGHDAFVTRLNKRYWDATKPGV